MTGRAVPHGDAPVLGLRDATLRYGDRVLWHGLDLDVHPGEFLAVLGPNGSGKTSLLHTLLGLRALTAGRAHIAGRPPRRGGELVGYVPQQGSLDTRTPLRARDIVRLGVDGHRWGLPLRGGAARRHTDRLLAEVRATDYADVPMELLSGGERQRIRIAQALATDPRVLLCDEPLLSLDPHHQRAVAALLDRRRRAHRTAVVCVTHEINPVIDLVDRVLYLAGGRFRTGTVDEVLTSDALSDLYGAPIEVVRAGDRIVVLGADDAVHGTTTPVRDSA